MEPEEGRGGGGGGAPGGRAAREGRERELRDARSEVVRAQLSLAAVETAREKAARERDEAQRDRDALAEQNARLVQVVGELKGLLAESRGQARRYRSERGHLQRQLEAATASAAAPGAAAGTAQGPQGFRIPRWSSGSDFGSLGGRVSAGPTSRERRVSGASASPASGGRESMDVTQTPPALGAPGEGVAPAARCNGCWRRVGGSGGGRDFREREPEPEDFLQTQMKKRRREAGQGEPSGVGVDAVSVGAGAGGAPTGGRGEDESTGKGAIAHVEVVRGKDARAALPGHDCPICAGFWNALGQPPPGGGGCSHTCVENQQQRPQQQQQQQQLQQPHERAALVQAASRHRARWRRPRTPPGFWDINLTPEST